MVDLRLVLALFLLLASTAQARPGDLDRSFGDRGRVAFMRESGGFVAGLELPDGKRPLLSVGTFPGPRLLSLTAAGAIAREEPVAALAAPRFSAGYALTQVAERPNRYTFGRVGQPPTATLTLPRASEPNQRDPDAQGFGVDGAGRIVVAIAHWTGERWRNRALRFLPDGTPDAVYGSPDLGAQLVTEILVRRDGGIRALTWPDKGGIRVLALDANGRRPASFHTRTYRRGLGEPHVIAAAPGGRLYAIGGDPFNTGWIARLRADGRLDRRFGVGGVRTLRHFTPNALVRDRRGRIVLAGLRQNRLYGQAGVAWLSARGRVERVVAKQLGVLRGVRLIASEAHHVAIDDRNRIVLAGETYDDDYAIRDDLGRSYPAVARLQG